MLFLIASKTVSTAACPITNPPTQVTAEPTDLCNLNPASFKNSNNKITKTASLNRAKGTLLFVQLRKLVTWLVSFPGENLPMQHINLQ